MRRDVRLRKLANEAKYELLNHGNFDPNEYTWKPQPGFHASKTHVTLFSTGNIYKLVRELATGAVTYYKLKDTGPEASSKDKIDAEPTPKQVRYKQGAHAWFIDTGGRWYCVNVVQRKQRPDRIVIASVTGWDADRVCAWPYGGELEFPADRNNPLFQRLRPLKARQA